MYPKPSLRLLTTTAVGLATIAVVGIVGSAVSAEQAEAVEACPTCALEGPSMTAPKVAFVAGGVLLASLVFVALGRAVGRRGGEV
jgi:hypothetical protein